MFTAIGSYSDGSQSRAEKLGAGWSSFQFFLKFLNFIYLLVWSDPS
jgi:hypothetical protein